MRRPLALLAAAWIAACSGPSPSPARVVSVRAPAASAEWWNGAVVYEVFVRSFQDSGADGIGDLAGLKARLDYLNDGNPATDGDLGVDAIWLMPVYASPSYHGYDVSDYDAVNPAYGTLADLTALVQAAHDRGMKVILDFVPNHTSVDHQWFRDSASSVAKRDWYVWSATDPRWGQPWGGGTTWYPSNGAFYYAAFWSGMPDLNWKNPAVAAEISAIASRWIATGIDGFRLDAVRYLVENGPGAGQQDQPGTHAALRDFVAGVRAAYPTHDPLVVGEAWADAATIATYYGAADVVPGGDELPLAFDFPLADAVVSAVASGDAGPLARGLDAVAAAMPAGVGDAPFLTNHDQQRVATRLGGDAAKERLAASILLTLQGTPFLYYGEEIGLANGACPSDECKRTPMAWDATANGGFTTSTPWFPLSPGTATANVASQTGDPASLLSRYRALVRARKASPALARGGTSRLGTEANGIVAYLRTDPSETVLVAHGMGGYAATVKLELPDATPEPILVDPGASLARDGGTWTLAVPAQGTGIWRLAPPP